ncbi:uncharacterized protein LOC114576269 [Exaiptasia diaphana]|uniref:Fibronectin type-III domain-containing protein n=1 Tax=Exaiptasia diaphana TaxID=2652724 RepID=A0A913YTH7_EXADI|nr:uncharacterized protein LOC114576269 [Exaiptasia diaphana]
MDLRLCVALVSCLNLLIHVQSSDAVANFTKVPNETLYLANGKTARFTWDFHVDNIKKELDSGSPRWYFYANSTTYWIGYGDAFNGRKFTIDTNTCPARFLRPTVRVSVEGKATLVIKNLTLADSGTYGCILFLAKGPDRLMPTSHVKLIVTGPPGSPVLKIVKFTNTTVTLMWSKPEENGGEIEYYTIYKKLAGAKKWLQVGTLSGEPLTYTVKELLPGKTYSFDVTAKNKDGPSLKGVNVKTVTLPIGFTNPPTTRSIGTIKVSLLTASLALVILLMLLIVVFISWKKRKKHDRRNNQNEDAVYCVSIFLIGHSKNCNTVGHTALVYLTFPLLSGNLNFKVKMRK